ncbi:MAG: gliding motility-associated C-terminal domain-containing protein [Bacteroidota bacterium]|nr:gliding motility-associated C-terminal domain-containing protein [Bacteroidota bacterium]
MQAVRNVIFLMCFLFLSRGENRAQQKDLPAATDLYEWVENKGQWQADIYFRCRQHALDLQIGQDYVSYYFFDETQLNRLHQHGPIKANPLPQDTSLSVYALTYQFLNASKTKAILENPKPHYYNFYLGNNPQFWAHKARASNYVGLQNLYPGIQLKIKSPNNTLKYEFWLEPNADYTLIKYNIQGAKNIYTEYGDLFIETPKGTLREQRPFAYQIIDNKRVQVQVDFKVTGNQISFMVEPNYNKSYPLVIDPEIVFLTYSGSTQDNFGCSATPGENGTLYAAGTTTGDPTSLGRYPATANAFQINYAGGGVAEGEGLGFFPCDITFSKYSSDGKTLLYASYLGGANNEVPHSMVIDKDANLILMGNTYSNNFPVSSNAYDPSHNGRHDIILSKFDKDGLLVGSTYLGGSGNDGINTNGVTQYFFADSYRGDVITDVTGNIYVASFTQSADYPTTPNCIQNNLKGLQDGAIFKINPQLSNLIWSTFLGGDGVDAFYSIDLDNNQNIFLSGGTNSTDIAGTIGSQNPNFLGGEADGIIMEIDNNGQNIIRSTYYGTNNYDQIISLERDRDNLIYVVGQSKGSMPVSPGVYNNPNAHQFIACLNPDLKSTVWSTVFGSGRNQIDLTINAFLVDECKRIYVSSWGGRRATKTDNTPSSTIGIPTTTDAFQTKTDGSDFYLLLLNKNASSLLYATFIGGDNPDNSGDHVDGGTSRFDKQGIVYQSMCASCPSGTNPFSDLKTTPGVYAPTNVSPRCSNAALKFDFRIENAGFEWTADTCASEFTFKNTTINASNFFWTFPDGESSYEENPRKKILPEYYGDTIRLIVEFGTNCADTAYGFVSLPDSLEYPNVPNIFSPNNDGLNDFFRIEGVLEQCNKTDIYVYNRWGQLYFEDHVSYFRWDGKNEAGIEAPEGVYFYILKTENLITGKKRNLHGTLTLVR